MKVSDDAATNDNVLRESSTNSFAIVQLLWLFCDIYLYYFVF